MAYRDEQITQAFRVESTRVDSARPFWRRLSRGRNLLASRSDGRSEGRFDLPGPAVGDRFVSSQDDVQHVSGMLGREDGLLVAAHERHEMSGASLDERARIRFQRRKARLAAGRIRIEEVDMRGRWLAEGIAGQADRAPAELDLEIRRFRRANGKARQHVTESS